MDAAVGTTTEGTTTTTTTIARDPTGVPANPTRKG
jgi:hypothetical protein